MKRNFKGFIARDKDYSLWLYGERPEKQMDEWGGSSVLENIESSHFPEVKWEDEEPTELELTIKRKDK